MHGHLICIASGACFKAQVKWKQSLLPDILLILWEAPEGDPKLQLFRHWWVDFLHHLKWNVKCYLLCRQLHQWDHQPI